MLSNMSGAFYTLTARAEEASQGDTSEETAEDETSDSEETIAGEENTAGEETAYGEEEPVGGETSSDEELCHQSFELYPNGEEAGQVVSVDGMMPGGAVVEAVDVSGEHDGIAAYDITILNGEDEYQPNEEHPLYVEITDPVITEGAGISLWHIKDDGTREQVMEFTVEDGKISFYAYGLSVYEIVEYSDDEAAAFFDAFAEYAKNGVIIPFYLSNKDRNDGPYYFLSGTVAKVVDTGRSGLAISEKNNPEGAIKLYFERIEGTVDKFYIYTKNGEGENAEKLYVKMFRQSSFANGRSALSYVSESEKTAFSLGKNDNNQICIHTTISGSEHYWVRNTKNGDIAVVGFASSTDSTMVWLQPGDDFTYTYNGFDGRTCGLMNYTGGTHGYALMADEGVHSLVELVTHQTATSGGTTYFVDEGSEITRWTFHRTTGDMYKLSASVGGAVQYLGVNGDDLVMTSADSAAEFKLTSEAGGKIKLSCDGRPISFSMTDVDGVATASFALSNGTGANTLLTLLDFSALADDDLITYSADRISDLEIENGKKYIVYTRLWDDDAKRYDMYAIDHKGGLYPCYASGGKLLWLGDGTGSLEWEFTEYYDSVTKEPNYYYELYNPYSEKYIAPQMVGNQILSDRTIGIGLPGRRNGEYYTDIVAWDNTYYAYIGMRPNDEKTMLVPCAESVSVPFYFATLEPLNLSDTLHEVSTLDNSEYGITLRMINFSAATGSNNASDSVVTRDYFGGDYGNTRGLLSTNLTYSGTGDVGYPTVVYNNLGGSLRNMYSGAELVNHLFLQSVHNSSGYFEFDSCQNFATLIGATVDEKGKNFTVYRELGTTNEKTKPTLQHGQFFPYNTITAGSYSSTSPQNLYGMYALASNTAEGKLEEEDPRKYENLHLINNPDYYFGMEMSAGFVQTASGLDEWGHDIIFDFMGDDDFWLYVDGELVIDLGGCHSAEQGRVNFRTGEVIYSLVNSGNTARVETRTTLIDIFRSNYQARGEENIEARLAEIFEDNGKGQYIFKDYSSHTMRAFYMERGAGASNLHMRFNIASVTPGHVVVGKTVSGPGAKLLDLDFLEYPFQIYYTLPEGPNGEAGPEHLLANDEQNIRVTYQNSSQPVSYVRRYRPPGFSDADAYESIYFINPTKNVEISFPDETITYRIVECAVDTSVYDEVTINDQTVPSDRIEIKGDLKSYSSEWGSAEVRPSIAFNNHVNADVIKDLLITKKLLDENDNEILDDPATFSFRLYLSSKGESGLTLANMYSYHVISRDKMLCKFDPDTLTFVETSLIYSRSVLNQLKEGPVDGITSDDVTFKTSGFGAISQIPAGYSIVVPGLPIGTIFKVTEDAKPGYGLVGYERVMGSKINADNTQEDIPSYFAEDGSPMNVGRIIAIDGNPQVEVHNKRGYGLSVKKKWSDLDITTGHSAIYVAVYADGDFVDDSVRKIESPDTSTYYFWTTLKPLAGGGERTNLDGYVVKEVLLTGASITVDADGHVSGYTGITVLESGDSADFTAVRTAAATPENESNEKEYEYVVSYEPGTFDGSSRTDTVVNTRKGGLAIRLFVWDSTIPLKGGTFVLKDASGNTIDTYTSNAEGLVTMMYGFERNKLYTLTQTMAPAGYVGLPKTVRFMVNADDSVTLYYEDGTTVWGDTDSKDTKWANYKPGSNGITAYVDVYNKKFNLKIAKVDSENHDIQLDSAHFALYKQANTTISGYVKNKDPMTGFEDMVTVNGAVYICGGDSGRVINPGVNGAVYFLTETQAPFGYLTPGEDEDIVFRISPLGIPSMISGTGELEETEDGFVFTISAPNEEDTTVGNVLTIEKKVEGAFGNRAKEFTFTVTFSGGTGTEKFAWAKNGDKQDDMPYEGATFTLKHGDKATIVLPDGITATVTEDSGGYTSTFKLGDGVAQTCDYMVFPVSGNMTLTVTNRLDGVVPTGVFTHPARTALLVVIPLIVIAGVLLIKRKKTECA